MRVVIDNNIVFSLMNLDSTNSRLFSILKMDYLSPRFIVGEFEKHKGECEKKSGLSKNKFLDRIKEVFDKIELVKPEGYSDYIKKSIAVSPDRDDAPYLALALKLNCPVWSNDSLLKKQSEVIILNTKEIIELVF